MFSSCYGKRKKDSKIKVECSNENVQRPTSASQVCPEVPGNNQANPETNSPESFSQDQKMKKKDKDLFEKDKEIQRLNETLESYRKSMMEKDERLSKYASEIKALKDQNESLLTRLSKMARERLTDGNPNIADLSDKNRPTKLAEMYSELYDNEWTNAYELLTKDGETEENACSILVKTLCVIYIICERKANENMESMKKAMKNFLGSQELQPELIKPFKDQRKKQFQRHIKDLKKELKDDIKKIMQVKQIRTDAKMKAFLHKCIELCWLMVIQDPPIFMDVNIKRYNEKYDSNSFKAYTQSGKYIEYIVWPPIFLQKGGSILMKGIAQCKPKASTPEGGDITTSQSTDIDMDQQALDRTLLSKDSADSLNRNSSNCTFQRNLITKPDEEEGASNIKLQTEKNETAGQVKSPSPSLMQDSEAKTNKKGNDVKGSKTEPVVICSGENHSLNEKTSSTQENRKRNSNDEKARSTVENTGVSLNVNETKNAVTTTHF